MRKALEQLAIVIPNTIELTICLLMEGVIYRVCPVHANSDLPTSIQSTVPSKFMVVIEVLAALVDISAVTGVVEEILW